MAALALAPLAACRDAPGRVLQQDPATVAAEITEAIDAARAEEGLPALSHSTCAAEQAAQRAAALVGEPDLEHAPLDGVLRQCDASSAGENLSRSVLPARDVVDAWLESPGHRANILDAEYTETGVACVPDGDAVLCSQVFLGR